jgi:hypothetical protein
VEQGTLKPVSFVQMIVRVSHQQSETKWAQQWYPHVEPSMLLLTLENKANLVHYVLHAKHGHHNDESTLESVFGEKFAESVEQAKQCFFS